jgi:hypothetical protein
LRYDQIALTSHVSIPQRVGPAVNFPSAPASRCPSYSLGFGHDPLLQNGRAGYLAVPPDGAVQIMNLISCAAAIYIYTNVAGAVHNVVVYHAHTGDIPAGQLPTEALHNTHNVPNAQIQVVFASSQSMDESPDRGIQTAADGLLAMLNAGVPLGNIRVLTGTGTAFGANDRGEVGLQAETVWRHGNLGTTLATVANQALTAYAAQFPAGQTTLGLLGSGHNLTTGRARIQRLLQEFNNARNDTARLDALQTFLRNNSYSFKAGSLKLMVVQQLNVVIRHQPAGNVTPLNAQAQGNNIISDIRHGNL